jgi:hypothetical protein
MAGKRTSRGIKTFTFRFWHIKLSGQKITPFGFSVEGFPQHPPGEKTLLAQASACNY